MNKRGIVVGLLFMVALVSPLEWTLAMDGFLTTQDERSGYARWCAYQLPFCVMDRDLFIRVDAQVEAGSDGGIMPEYRCFVWDWLTGKLR